MTHSASLFILHYLLIPIAAVWVYHLVQRRYREQGARKRDASLYLTLVLLGVWVLAYVISRTRLQDLYLVPVCFAALVVLVWKKDVILPYRLRCVSCGRPLSILRILFIDSNTCEACQPLLREGETTS